MIVGECLPWTLVNSRIIWHLIMRSRGEGKMNKTYISSLLVVLVATQTIRAQDSLDDVFAQLDAAQGGTEQAAAPSGTAP